MEHCPVKRSNSKTKGYTAKDMRAVSHKPEWTQADFAKAKPFSKAFPELGKNRSSKASTKKQKRWRITPSANPPYER
jgi:hypothetical protein